MVEWKAVIPRVVVVPLYMYIGMSVIVSVYSSELSFNVMDWSIYIRTTFSFVMVVIYGLVILGLIEGNFKK